MKMKTKCGSKKVTITVMFSFVDKKEEQQQLLAIVNVNSAVDDDKMEGLKRAMGDFWGENRYSAIVNGQ